MSDQLIGGDCEHGYQYGDGCPECNKPMTNPEQPVPTPWTDVFEASILDELGFYKINSVKRALDFARNLESDRDALQKQLAEATFRLNAERENLRMEEAKRSAVEGELAEERARLSSLLARIHRDGGHCEAEHGTEKACADADEIIARFNALSDPRW